MKYCRHCKKSFSKPSKLAYWQWDRQVYCSKGCRYKAYIPWNKGKKIGKTWNKGMKTNLPSWNAGKKWNTWMSPQGRCNALKNIAPKYREKHWNWQGGITEQNRQFRNSREYKEWRIAVFERDKFRCVLCGYRSIKKRDIRADHIKPFSLFPDERLVVSNGRTLCLPCDLRYGWQLFREDNPRKRVVTN